MTDATQQPDDAPAAQQSPAAVPASHVSRRGLFAMGAGGLAVGALAGVGGTLAAQALDPKDQGDAVAAGWATALGSVRRSGACAGIHQKIFEKMR